MLKNILATSALATLLTTAAFAQTEPVAPGDDPAAPTLEQAPAEVMPDVGVAPGETLTPDAETAAEETMTEPLTGQAATEQAWAPISVSEISADQLIGVDIVTHENETIASIEDVILTADGQVESLVAQFGGFLGFGSNKVLLTMDEVEIMQDADESLIVRTALTPELIEARPVYEEN